MDEGLERKHVALATEGLVELTGRSPVGWFGGRPSVNTRRLLVEQGGYLYDRDYLGDELPFWVEVGGRILSCLTRTRPTTTASMNIAASLRATTIFST